MGTADQLMDLSLTHPYPGANKLVERMLGIKDVSEKYRKLLQELSEKAFTREQMLKDVAAIEQLTKEPLAKEKKAAAAQGGGRRLRPTGRGCAAAAGPEDVCREANRVHRGAARRQEQGLRSRRLRTASGRRWRSL